ncbi:DUF808 domain-containing protein [Albimonas pacifica]|uniref:Inner membrane protein YedI n=1 Tax=Albimonas pacifica TaxID=1114924 RepID=A0A1I3DUF4_9RHOB|nr:DUF808 domain-containing protein [Albimonas pacifica]SFH90218.1 hypothetical protein SAMN05216258_10314 [Albimonas pacifica]
MSGLLALLDDVAAIAKLASTQIDDIVGQTAKAGSKAVGVVIDDAAVTPKYVHGIPAARELPIVMRIARGSLFNKLVVLLPAALLLEAFLPWALTPLLMLGGFYLCFEGAEKIVHALHPHPESHTQEAESLDAAHLEKQRVAGAIKTDFILSAEIMTISLSAIETESIWIEAVALATVAFFITALVYGAVALLVKMDDLGLRLAQDGGSETTRAFGRRLVRAMPGVMSTIAAIGTAAMLWVGGNILTHGVAELGFPWLYETIHHMGAATAEALGVLPGLVAWAVAALVDGVLGLVIGLALIPAATHVFGPMAERVAEMLPSKGGETG